VDTYGALERAEQLKRRTKLFALRVLKVFQSLPKLDEARVVGKQLLRSGTSVGANYRAVCRARTRKEFIAKIGVVIEEADETVFWFELLIEGGIVPLRRLDPLLREANELLAIFCASQRTAKRRRGPK
jgi:four helix bundle protein